MSAFECNITPTRVRNARKRTEDKEPTIVDLRPFTGKSICTFEDVPIAKIARRTITILNPFAETLKVTIVKIPKPEHNLALDWMSNEISSEACANLEVVWNPLKVVSCRETIEISDHFGNRKTVAIILKSCEVKKTGTRKPGVVDFNKKLKLKAPSPPKIFFNRNHTSSTNKFRTEFMENKIIEEYKSENMPSQMSPKRRAQIPRNSVLSPLRNATNIQNKDDDFPLISQNIGKQNDVIMTPPNASVLFNNIKFTPLTETKPKGESKLDYLSSRPTPVITNRDDIAVPKEILLRKNLMHAAISPEVPSRREEEKTPQIRSRQEFLNERHTVDETPRRSILRSNNNMKMANDLASKLEDIEEGENLTYVKGPYLEEINEIDIILTNASMSETETFYTPPEHNHQRNDNAQLQTTFKVNKSRSFCDDLSTDAFDCQHPVRPLSESMREPQESPTVLQKEKLRANQGSMPNLNDINVQHIEHNRYFYAEQQQVEVRTQNISMESIVSNTDFKEIERCVQSSRLNLNEIGRPRKTSSPITDTIESPLKPQSKKKKVSPPSKYALSPTIQRIREEEQEVFDPLAGKKLLTFSPPKNKLSDINEMYRRETFTVSNKGDSYRVTTWKQQQNQHTFAIPKVPRESIFRPSTSTITQSLTSLSSSVASLSSTNSMPTTSGKLYNENLINAYSQKDPFSATTTEDPFLSSSMYLDERTLDGIEKSFKKWLNALVTIPPDLETDRNEKIDVAKVFNDVQNKELTLAPTREIVCSQYYTARLDQLRMAAVRFFHSEEISKPLNKLAVVINEKKLLEVNSARHIHLDIVLQRGLLELLLCFNPLWLRIGLEVVFNVQLNLTSNQDIFGMSRFIIMHMFKSPYLQQKYSKYNQQQELLDKLKKHTAKNFLFLLFFLDRAKENRLIKQNPCLFMKVAPYKESNEILKKFASLVLANYGDIIRQMKRLDYMLTHKQTVIDEFDYAFKNLAVDLRDGVRLTKVMEVISLRDDLVKRVRVPAISRLQKVHNVELALKALEAAEYKIVGNITAKDIADGHREKTLSLLWQIIYKFRAPRFNAAAKTIQKFWRSSWLKIVIERRIRMKEEMRLNNAAIVIQKFYRGYRQRKLVKEYREKIIDSCKVIQKYVRGYLERKRYRATIKSIIYVQRVIRSIQTMRFFRKEFLLKRTTTIKIQIWWRRQILVRKIIAASSVIKQIQIEMADVRYQKALKIQKYWKCYQMMKQARSEFLHLKAVTTSIQERFRCKLKMREIRRDYLHKRESTAKIQRYWRATVEMRKQRNEYQKVIQKITFIQRKFRANQQMKLRRAEYEVTRNSIIKIQLYYRSYQMMKRQRFEFAQIKSAAIVLQKHYRARLAMKSQRDEYTKQKSSVIKIQKFWRSSWLKIIIERRISIKEEMRLNNAAIVIQQYYRGYRQCKLVKEYRKKIIDSCKVIQKYVRGYLERKRYRATIKSIIYVQRVIRSIQTMRFYRKEFLLKRTTTIKIQIWWRRQILVRKIIAASNVIKQIQIEIVNVKHQNALKIQNYWKGYQMMKQARSEFLHLKAVTTSIQERFRCKLKMREIRRDYLHKRESIVKIQRYWRATVEMRKQRNEYQEVIQKITFIQRKFRANQQMKLRRAEYQVTRSSIIKIQLYYRSYLLMRRERQQFLLNKQSTLTLQRHYRARLAMKSQRDEFTKQKSSAIKIQKFWRSYMLMRKERCEYLREIEIIKSIQMKFRNKLKMRQVRHEFLQKRTAVIKIQRLWRSTLEMRRQRIEYQKTVERIVFIQRRFRANQAMREAMCEYNKQKCAIVTIQKWFRSYKEMMKTRSDYLLMKKTVLLVENRIIANRLMNIEREKFNNLRETAIFIQKRFRSKIETRRMHQQFIKTKVMTLKLQSHVRGYLGRKRFKEMQTPENIEMRRRHKAARTIQAAWRGCKERSKKSNRCFRAIVERLIKVSRNIDPTQTLASKLKISIEFLKYRYDSNVAISTLAKLEYMSRTVPWILTDDAEFVSAFCYGIMGQAIRSEIDKQIIELCSCIILNLGRFNGTKEDAFQENGLITIAQMLLRWCDKDCGIFNTLCTLVWVFSHCDRKKMIIRKFMTMKDGEFIMAQIKQNVLRKENMRKNSRRPIGFQSISLIKYKKDYQLQLRHQPQTSSQFSSGFISADMLKQCREFPSLDPDYGVVRMHPYIFYSSVFAFDSVLKFLNINNVK